ncbi:HAD hydrolase-like protein [Sedimentitalea sp. JM2-8]|uniref:HAD hydrolase-like protein n=1 Tax=Sedimentitalea xiamensis TaxID=3050037 RepID=A0ABT7FFE7_9RHOB|nr:HAD hydrolase-like protein [Sedimentitalea xiamensis]MDK3073700.1 HAD hydrolase-like protein [Sedimentitalea xiamensis]
MDDAVSIFDRYQAVRHRLPKARCGAATVDVESLLDIAPEVDAFVFDAFGVLNVGETPIPGAAERLDQLRAAGHMIRILSNAASYDHAGATEKFRKLGIRISPDEIVTSRDAAIRCLGPGLWGCIAAPDDDLSDIPADTIRLDDGPAEYDRVDNFLFLSTESWRPERQAMLRNSLMSHPRPVVIANADLAAPRDFGFSLEPGHFGHLLADDGLADIRFLGKPFPEVYEMVESSLAGVPPERIAMCGDTLHTDILGAVARGWRTVLVTRDGMFSGMDTRGFCDRSALVPTWRLPRI